MAAARAAVAPGGEQGAGFFDFMFKGLPAFSASDADLQTLANAMKETAAVDQPNPDPLENTKIPSGFTYLGQFVDHDITLDMTPLSRALADPEMVKNFRSPSLDLDCVYGAGPGPHRFLFERSGGVDTPKLLIGTAQASAENSDRAGQVPELPNDLPRNMQGVALIGDHRNDENLIVAQLHLTFLKFHNAVIDHLKAKGVAADTLFEEAARTVRWHYQWMVLHDWVERLTGPGFVDKTLHDGRKFYRFQTKPFMPWEFSAAAYRLGHSMVREKYSHNRIFRTPNPHLAEGTLSFLFRFTNLSGSLSSSVPGNGTLPSDWVIDWRRFFELPPPANKAQFEFNFSRRLDPLLTPALHNLPGSGGPDAPPSLAFRNLKRGVRVGLPSGQAVAKEMLKQITFTPLTENEIASGPDGAVAKSLGFHKNTPLWYYILKEAQVKGGGERLGPVGAQIVGEVFVGLVQGDETSFLSQPGWKPDLPAATPGTFLMTDLLTFVAKAADPANPGKALNPIGD
ncbi:heme peroxidase family protein [Mesorhizobium sp. GbtcB19]|uniref:peroxidase family protein n=1 Tax=Mesorhizobium sp. GbtcB19 TaxID=2824764 RepID=UPI0020C64048|nr:heme peroxidase family protein [Mesorhizobium sp. GbtcB19]